MKNSAQLGPSVSRWSISALALGLATAAAVVGCGSDDKGGEGKSGGMNDIDLGGSQGGAGAGEGGPKTGGRVDLTPDQISALENAACTGWSGEGENLPAVLQLVVDVSHSMNTRAPGGNASRWAVTYDALQDAIDDMPASVSLGMLLYPNMNTTRTSSPSPINQCVAVDELVPIAQLGNPGSDHRETLGDLLDDANVRSYTPTHDAYQYALENSLLPFQTSAKKFMLLITDGAPTLAQNCIGNGDGPVIDMPTAPIVDAVEEAYVEHDVRTFLIGSPGSEQSSHSGGDDMRPWLSEAAMLGGTASDGCSVQGPAFCHLDMTQEPDFAAALRSGLASIAGQIIDSCTFRVPTAPAGESINPNLTNLVVEWGPGGASLILQDDTGDCSDGWVFNDDGDVVLCDATCDEVKFDSGARVRLTFGCSSDEVGVVIR